MKTKLLLLTIFSVALLLSCGGGQSDNSSSNTPKQPSQSSQGSSTNSTDATTSNDSSSEEIPASERVNLTDKGVGPIKSVTLDPEINQELAGQGAEVFKMKCTACHKTDKNFIGPSPKGILNRRTPEWIMNMILNPEGMVKEDPLAKDLLIEYNGSPMANQNLTEEEARSVLEFFRTLN